LRIQTILVTRVITGGVVVNVDVVVDLPIEAIGVLISLRMASHLLTRFNSNLLGLLLHKLTHHSSRFLREPAPIFRLLLVLPGVLEPCDSSGQPRVKYAADFTL